MRFRETRLKGAFLIDLDLIEDDRGYFSRSFCQREFVARGLKAEVAQCNVSFNRAKGTLRGMHFQREPMSEAKLVRCTRGKIYDVIIDLRPTSETFRLWEGFELSAESSSSIYVPEGFAHGFQTLEENSELFYQMFQFYAPEYASGVRWDDPLFGISWPLPNPVVSSRDSSFPYRKSFEL